ncbi:hypothetical protein [Pendulispora albinea]|uniref:Uncharacterized protein n=1 Tax=Pendulispora albinea TaxID=2741071 RepID=A0ABZ2LL17_9BACT
MERSLEPAERRARTTLTAGIAASFLGLAIAATLDRTLGGALLVFGWGAAAYAVHRLGRLGGKS